MVAECRIQPALHLIFFFKKLFISLFRIVDFSYYSLYIIVWFTVSFRVTSELLRAVKLRMKSESASDRLVDENGWLMLHTSSPALVCCYTQCTDASSLLPMALWQTYTLMHPVSWLPVWCVIYLWLGSFFKFLSFICISHCILKMGKERSCRKHLLP